MKQENTPEILKSHVFNEDIKTENEKDTVIAVWKISFSQSNEIDYDYKSDTGANTDVLLFKKPHKQRRINNSTKQIRYTYMFSGTFYFHMNNLANYVSKKIYNYLNIYDYTLLCRYRWYRIQTHIYSIHIIGTHTFSKMFAYS